MGRPKVRKTPIKIPATAYQATNPSAFTFSLCLCYVECVWVNQATKGGNDALDDTNEALKIWGALKPMIDAEIAEKTTSCVRSKKMNVVSAPSGTTIGVCEPFDTKIYHIPYVSSLAKASVGDTVWVKWYFNNASTMIATSYGDGLDDVSYPLPISLGGTGASTKANAKTALDIDDLETAYLA